MSNILNRENYPGPHYPEKIIQFGEGNFLRAFLDWMIDILNQESDFNSGITIVRPINTNQPKLDSQDGLYTALIRGINEQGVPVANPRIVYSVNRELSVYTDFQQYLVCAENPELEWVFSNTTEAGIAYSDKDKLDDAPPSTFPAKLTRFLWHRFSHFNGAKDKGLIIVPCELIDYNGEQLKKIIFDYAKLWNLPNGFINWLEKDNTFCSTLVDRIVTGYPKTETAQLEKELGYQDRFLVTAEYFYLFVIQGPAWLKAKLKLNTVNLNIVVVDDIKPYKERKVGILNGAHTAMVPVAYLAGHRAVGETLSDPLMQNFVNTLLQHEVIPTLSLDKAMLEKFAADVLDRFRNPYIQHELLSISLNSLTKFKTRLLPQLLTYSHKFGQAPTHISYALAALIAFYRGRYAGQTIPLADDQWLLDRFTQWAPLYDNDPPQLVREVLGMQDHWGLDLNTLPHLSQTVTDDLVNILSVGIVDSLPH